MFDKQVFKLQVPSLGDHLKMEKKEYLYKILVIGDNAVGKSSIVRRYVHNFFTERYKATVSFLIKPF